ncbi:MAG: arginyltransferase [Candidatus Binatia bacterium]
MESTGGSRRLTGHPPEWVVYDQPSPCPYLPRQTARLPLRLPLRPLRPAEFSQRLQVGDRRQGLLLYRPHCPDCRACEAIRIDVRTFAADKTQRRVFRRGEALLRTEIGLPMATAEKVALFNRHKVERGLLDRGLADTDAYEQFLVETCTDSLELTYRQGNRLIGVAVADRAADALSAVYCFYDPDATALSPGVYSILKEVELCRAWGLRYLYLGFYIADCRPMRYKTRYLPHERRINGVWRPFDR